MIRSVVLHSLLFCRHGEQPPGRASQRILRICRSSVSLSYRVMPSYLVCPWSFSPCTDHKPGPSLSTHRQHPASCCHCHCHCHSHSHYILSQTAAAAAAAEHAVVDAASPHRSWRICSATRCRRQLPPVASWMASSAEHARRVTACSALFAFQIVRARASNAKRPSVALILQS